MCTVFSFKLPVLYKWMFLYNKQYWLLLHCFKMWHIEEKTGKCWLHITFMAILLFVTKFSFISLIFSCVSLNEDNKNWTNPHFEVKGCDDPIWGFCIWCAIIFVCRLPVHISRPTPLPKIKVWECDKYQSLPTPVVQSPYYTIDGKRKILYYPAYAEGTKKLPVPQSGGMISGMRFEPKIFHLQRNVT